MTERKRGRPKSGYQVRDAEVSFSLTAEHAQWLAELASRLGFKDRGQMVTAILERLRAGGWAPVAFAKLGFQFYQLVSRVGPPENPSLFNPFRKWPPLPEEMPTPTAPIPALADVEDLSARQRRLLLQVEKQTT